MSSSPRMSASSGELVSRRAAAKHDSGASIPAPAPAPAPTPAPPPPQAPKSCFAAARRDTSSPLEALTRGLEDMASMAPTPEELSNHLAFLQIDLTDPDFHKLALANALTNRNGIVELLDEAIGAGELKQCDTDRLSVAVDAIAGGALINWAIHREGTAREAIRDALETLLGPYSVGWG